MLVNLGGGGIALPELTSPGNENDLLNGKQLINQDGEIVIGKIPLLEAKNYTPSSRNQTIQSGQYLSGAQTILGDSNLISTNIKAGVNIFGVQGNLTVSSGTFNSSMFSLGMYGGANHQVITFPIEVTRLIAIIFPVDGNDRLIWIAGGKGTQYPSLPTIGSQSSYILTQNSTASSFSFGSYGGSSPVDYNKIIDGTTNTSLWQYYSYNSGDPGVYWYI